MGQSAQYGHLFFVHKIHRKNEPDERSGENASSPGTDSSVFEKWPNFLFFMHNFSLFCNFHKIMIEILFSFMYNVHITVHTRI